MIAAYHLSTGYPQGYPQEFTTMHRRPVSKGRSASQFRRNVGRTKSINMRAAPMRGGIRL